LIEITKGIVKKPTKERMKKGDM